MSVKWLKPAGSLSVNAKTFEANSPLAKRGEANHSSGMAKVSKKTAQSGKSYKFAAGAKVLGTTKDGVRILKPKGKATHFTQKELRGAVASVRAAKKA